MNQEKQKLPDSAGFSDRESLNSGEDRFRSLFRATTAASADFRSQLQEVLMISAQSLQMNMGLVSQIDQEKGAYHVYSVYPSNTGMPPGVTLPLQHTYCRIKIDTYKQFVIIQSLI